MQDKFTLIVGPTRSGKTTKALELAEKFRINPKSAVVRLSHVREQWSPSIDKLIHGVIWEDVTTPERLRSIVQQTINGYPTLYNPMKLSVFNRLIINPKVILISCNEDLIQVVKKSTVFKWEVIECKPIPVS